MSKVSKKTLRNLYIKQNLTKKQIARKLRIKFLTIAKLLNKSKIIKPPLGYRKHSYINLDRFESIKDSQAAYLLGYIAWAGFKVREDVYLISARESQYPALEKIKTILKIKNPDFIKQRKLYKNQKEYLSYHISLSKKGLIQFISKWYYGDPNIKPFRFPPIMDLKYLPDYLRGYLDRHSALCHSSNGIALLVSTPYLTFSNQLKSSLDSFGIKCSVKTRTQISGKISTGIYISVKSYVDLYDLLFKNKFSHGTQLENMLKEEKIKRAA